MSGADARTAGKAPQKTATSARPAVRSFQVDASITEAQHSGGANRISAGGVNRARPTAR